MKTLAFVLTLSWLSCTLPVSVCGQTQQGHVLSIRGRVIDLSTDEGVAGAEVLVVGTKLRDTTDTDGRFALPLSPGKYAILAHKGRKLVAVGKKMVEVKPGQPSSVDIFVVPSSVKRRAQAEAVRWALSPNRLGLLTDSENLVRDPDFLRYLALDARAEALAKQVRETTDQQKRAELEKQLREIVNKMFDARTAYRKKTIETTERLLQRAKKLLEQSVRERDLLIEHKISELLYGRGVLDW
ncbi:MAG: hypothetical protein GXO73_07740 [Calditrichaeota bacterium]|nr:hypothetical protein [Calditrichota bacterium]